MLFRRKHIENISLCITSVLFAACFPSLPPETDGDSSEVVSEDTRLGTDLEAPSDGSDIGKTSNALAPTGLTATTTLEDRITVTWQPVPGAVGYQLFRDEALIATTDGVDANTYDDRASALAVNESWKAPLNVLATDDDPHKVTVTWTSPDRPQGPIAVYSVAAISTSGVSPASETVEGRRAAPALDSWEVETVFEGVDPTWVSTQGSETSWSDIEAPQPTITPPTITASDEAYRKFVRLEFQADDVVINPVTYRVRGRLVGGGFTPPSMEVSGSRAAVVVTETWQVFNTVTGLWVSLEGEDSQVFDDEGAPTDGTSRQYRRYAQFADGREIASLSANGRRLAFVDISTSGTHTCAVTKAGRLWCWGSNTHSELGRQTISTVEAEPSLWSGSTEVAQVVMSATPTGYGAPRYTCVLTRAGQVICFGALVGEPTLGTELKVIELPDVATGISVGLGMSCAILASGEARCWGINMRGGGLGDGTETISSQTPVPLRHRSAWISTIIPLTQIEAIGVGGGAGGCAKLGNSLYCWPNDENLAEEQTEYGVNSLWKGGLSLHRCVIRQTGDVGCWGEGAAGQLGQGLRASSTEIVSVSGLTNSPVKEVAVGLSHTCALQHSGVTKCWGAGSFGQLGHGQSGTDVESLTPVMINDGEGATHITAGGDMTCAIIDSMVYCWGRNDFGQLGTGDTNLRSVPTPIVTP